MHPVERNDREADCEPFQLYVHGYDLESLYKHVPKRLLPTEYGGEAGTIPSLVEYWEKKLLDNRDALLEWEQYGTNESLRRGAPITEESLGSLTDGQNLLGNIL